MEKEYFNKKLAFFICIGFIFSITIVLFTPLNGNLGKPLIVNQKPTKSDVIIVLSAGAYNTGLPDFETIIRLHKGMELYQKGYADKIICAGGVRYQSVEKSIAEIMKDTLIQNGIPGDRILIQDETTNTYRDITYLLNKFQNDFDFNKVIFVTSSYHTFRVKKILQKKYLAAKVISAEVCELNTVSWFERFYLFKNICREYGAIIYSKMRGWI